jgi:hypothetical protein
MLGQVVLLVLVLVVLLEVPQLYFQEEAALAAALVRHLLRELVLL